MNIAHCSFSNFHRNKERPNCKLLEFNLPDLQLKVIIKCRGFAYWCKVEDSSGELA